MTTAQHQTHTLNMNETGGISKSVAGNGGGGQRGAACRRHVWIAANTTWYIVNFRSSLIRTLVGQGYRVTVFSPTDRYVSHVLALGAFHVHLPLHNSGTNPFVESITLARIAWRISRASPAVALTFTPKVNIYVSLAARLLGLAVIANVSGLGRSFASNSLVKTVAGYLYKLAFCAPRKVFFQNSEDMRLFVAAGWVQEHNSKRLPGSGVDTKYFAPLSTPRVKGVFTFLLAARLIREKGIEEFAKAAAQIKNEQAEVKFQLLGFLDEGRAGAITASQINAWVASGWIDYLGATDDIKSHLANADCVVLPSFYREGVPRVLLEASSMAIPIITTNTVGCKDALEDGKSGYLCEAQSVHSLADSMRRMLSLSSEERQQMGAAGRQKMIREFDESIVISSYLEELANL